MSLGFAGKVAVVTGAAAGNLLIPYHQYFTQIINTFIRIEKNKCLFNVRYNFKLCN